MNFMKTFTKITSRNYCRTAQNKANQIIRSTLISQESYNSFMDSLPMILNGVFVEEHYLQNLGITDHIREIIDYNVKDGKKLRGALTLHTYHTLSRPENVSEESLRQAHVLAWATEMLHSCFIILDDIEDETKTRRGRPCWHLLPGVGKRALNDVMMLRNFINEMLKTNFEHNPKYGIITDLFLVAFIHTAIGQNMDYAASKVTNRDYSHFNVDLYEEIIRYKTQFYSFELPILLGLALVDRCNRESQTYVETVCNDIARVFQMQDDYLDCYGETKMTGKIGTDIQNDKCTWLAATAMENCSKPQRIVFQACYGSREPAHIDRIKRLYDQLKIPQIYKEQQRKLYNRVMQLTKERESTDKIPSELFMNLLNVINDRKL